MSKVHKKITEMIVSELKNGTVPWVKPWHQEAHHNPVSGSVYKGINPIFMEAINVSNFYGLTRWITFKQAEKLGLRIVKGSKSSLAVYFSFVEKKNDEGEVIDKFAMLKTYRVFNVQCLEGEGVEKLQPNFKKPIDKVGRYKKAQAFIDALVANKGLVLKEGHKAFYLPSQDVVSVPPKALFTAIEHGDGEPLSHYYATLLHEVTHWTGAEHRLNRDQGEKGTDAYAFEELVAELGASMLCGELGLPYTTQHASYIKGWLSVLEGNDKAFMQASSLANKAVKYLLDAAGENDSGEVCHAA